MAKIHQSSHRKQPYLPLTLQFPHSYELFRVHSIGEDVCLFQKSVELDKCDAAAFATMMLEEVVFNTGVFFTRSRIYSIGCTKCSIIVLKYSGLDYFGFTITKIHYRYYFQE